MMRETSFKAGLIATLREKYFSSTWNAIISLISLAIILASAWLILDWAIFSATFGSAGAQACKSSVGACWNVIAARWRMILFGLYPYAEQWRTAVSCVIVIIMMVVSCIPSFWKAKRIVLLWFIGTATFYILMKGGFLGLTRVDEGDWGGLTLTLFIFVAVTVIGMPLALALALMRRSRLPLVSLITAGIIDTIRSLPLLAILFTFTFMVPLITPEWLKGDKLYRAIVGAALYLGAYQSENIRSGIQTVSGGQEEAAKSLGLGYWHCMSRVVLPQAFKYAMPALVNRFVIIFKETSLFLVIGFFGLLASGNLAYASGGWGAQYVEVFFFVALTYFVFVFSLSRYGAFLERRLSKGQR